MSAASLDAEWPGLTADDLNAADLDASQTLREIRLHGVLGKRFGRVFHLAVNSAAEAVRALCVLVPGFEEHLLQHSLPGYKVWVDKRGIGCNELTQPVGTRECIRISPVVSGAKAQGLGQVILGDALIAAGVWMTGNPFIFTGAVASAFTSAGIAMVLGGVIQMLSPQRVGKDTTPAAGTPSYNFSGSVNVTEEGVPVPVAYGRVWAGSVVISGGINTTDVAIPAPAPAPAPAVTLPVEQPRVWDGGS